MVARVARFEGVNIAEAQRTMDEADSIIAPLVEGLQGYRGDLFLAAQGGDVISVSFFESAEDAQAAERTFDEEMPRALGDLFQGWEGRRVSAGVYEVVSDTRT
jgi:hypothetical protein